MFVELKKNLMTPSRSAPLPVVLPSQREARDNQDAVNIVVRYKITLLFIEKLNKSLTVFVFAEKKQPIRPPNNLIGHISEFSKGPLPVGDVTSCFLPSFM